MKLKLYIVRHGQTQWNVEKRMQGRKDSPLTELGKAHSEKLMRTLKDTKWEAIYSSSSQRTLLTADIIRGEQKIPIISRDELQEMCFGDMEGKLHKDIAEQEPQKFEDFWLSPDLYTSGSGEDFFEVEKRVIKEIKKIIRQHPEGNVLIVTHTVVIKLLIAFFEKRPLETLWDPIIIHPTALSIVEVENDQTNILLHGDTSHF